MPRSRFAPLKRLAARLPDPLQRPLRRLYERAVLFQHWFWLRAAEVFTSNARVQQKVARVSAGSLRQDPDYHDYLFRQIDTSYKRSFANSKLKARTVYLIDQLASRVGALPEGAQGLCVGPRNTNEIEYLESSCGVSAVGLDLFSDDPKIQVGDMHRMPFEDDRFQVLFSCHSLEHSYDPRIAIAEFVRVLRDGGYAAIEIPVNFTATDVDRWDLKNSAGLLACFPDGACSVVFEENSPKACRAIVRIHK
jgi:SAM-dependent methyltransferase